MENTELHIWRPGDRTSVVLCRVLRHDEKRMALTARPPYDEHITFDIVALGESLVHDQCPPWVGVSTKTKNLRGEWEESYFTGYLYDMSIMSDVNKMIIIEHTKEAAGY